MGVRAFLIALLLLSLPAMAQETLTIAPNQTLTVYASPRRDQPVDAKYSLHLEAGEWVAITAPASLISGVNNAPELELVDPAGESTIEHGTLVHHIGKSGAWTLALRGFHAVAVTLYPSGHHVVEPGLEPKEIALVSKIPGSISTKVEPFYPPYRDSPPPSGIPARLVVTVGETLTIEFYRRDAPRQVDLWADDAPRSVEFWLNRQGEIVENANVPIFPSGSLDQYYIAKSGRLRGACFDFIRFVGFWGQDVYYPFGYISYAATGISHDGEWFVVANARFPAPKIQGLTFDETHDGRSEAYEAAMTKLIDTDPNALTPSLADMDETVRSLSARCDQR